METSSISLGIVVESIAKPGHNCIGVVTSIELSVEDSRGLKANRVRSRRRSCRSAETDVGNNESNK